MENLGHFIWIVFTFPLWVSISVIWIVGKFLIFLLFSLYGIVFKGGFNSIEDLLLFPKRLIFRTFENSNIVYDKFSEIYYEKSPILMSIIIFITIIIYSAMVSSRK